MNNKIQARIKEHKRRIKENLRYMKGDIEEGSYNEMELENEILENEIDFLNSL